MARVGQLMRRAGTAARGDAAAAAGFSLVEILAVIAILAILMSLVLIGYAKYKQKAYEEATRGLIERVQDALEKYRAAYSRYPPDGFDFPVYRTQGGRSQIRGSQCLVYFLGLPTRTVREYGDDIVEEELDPFLQLSLDELTGGGDDLDDRLAASDVELIDPYGFKIFYDNTERDQNGNARVSIQSDGDTPDPRASGGSAGRAKNPGQFDLWSRGTDPADPADDINNW